MRDLIIKILCHWRMKFLEKWIDNGKSLDGISKHPLYRLLTAMVVRIAPRITYKEQEKVIKLAKQLQIAAEEIDKFDISEDDEIWRG